MALTMCFKFDLKNLSWRVGTLSISADSVKKHAVLLPIHQLAETSTYALLPLSVRLISCGDWENNDEKKEFILSREMHENLFLLILKEPCLNKQCYCFPKERDVTPVLQGILKLSAVISTDYEKVCWGEQK